MLCVVSLQWQIVLSSQMFRSYSMSDSTCCKALLQDSCNEPDALKFWSSALLYLRGFKARTVLIAD